MSSHPSAPHPAQMTFNVSDEVERFFDDSSRSRDERPVFKLFLGAVATGKTT